MLTRVQAWRRQAASDLAQAKESHAAGRAEWACYAASQAGEKSVKAGLIALGVNFGGGGNIVALLEQLATKAAAPLDPDLTDDAKVLTQFGVLARYPTGEDAVAPVDLLTRGQAAAAVTAAERIAEWVNRHVFKASSDEPDVR